MNGFLNWFFAFMSAMFGGLWLVIKNFFKGFVTIFDIPAYIRLVAQYKADFGWFDWILTILTLIIALAIWAGVIFLIVLGIRKLVRLRKSLASRDDLLEEIADLHRDVIRLTSEKEKIMALKISQSGMTMDELRELFEEQQAENGEVAAADQEENDAGNGAKRFARLTAVDEKYQFYLPPPYQTDMSLKQLCDDLRNYACNKSRLYYEIKTIRLMFAGLASTKLIILQGISGTGKTSLPYVMGKYFKNDATIASVQPSWRDRSELFGFFNEFTMKFNETEVLKRIYEASYNDDINIVLLDEMNIARVEYYFAEMLSILEMPDPNEWKVEIVPSSWKTDPAHLADGKLTIPQNVWYVGTANNDDSTFSISDKVYDRALVINLDSKGMPFDAPETESKYVSYSYVESLYQKAVADNPVSEELLDAISRLDLYVIEKFRVAFGNRIMKQLKTFVPVYVACGGEVLDGLDYLLATKVFRKFESLNLSLIRDEIKGLIAFLDKTFGKGVMKECIEYLLRLQKMY